MLGTNLLQNIFFFFVLTFTHFVNPFSELKLLTSEQWNTGSLHFSLIVLDIYIWREGGVHLQTNE